MYVYLYTCIRLYVYMYVYSVYDICNNMESVCRRQLIGKNWTWTLSWHIMDTILQCASAQALALSISVSLSLTHLLFSTSLFLTLSFPLALPSFLAPLAVCSQD